MRTCLEQIWGTAGDDNTGSKWCQSPFRRCGPERGRVSGYLWIDTTVFSCLDGNSGRGAGRRAGELQGKGARDVLAFLIGGWFLCGGAWAPTRGAPTGGLRSKGGVRDAWGEQEHPSGEQWFVVSGGAGPLAREERGAKGTGNCGGGAGEACPPRLTTEALAV